MIKKVSILLAAGAIFLVALSAVAISSNSRKIVVFEKELNGEQREKLVQKHASLKVKDLDFVNAKVVYLTDKDAENLKHEKGVLRVEEDVVVSIQGAKSEKTRGQKGGGPTILPSQVLPWGVDKIDAELVWPTGNTADPIKVGVIDTGISSNHSDLANNIKGGINTISSRKSWNDDNGHGSHVAGIIAALNNSQGVVGVAPQADLYAIKVLSSNGSGYISDVIEGIDWARTNGINVINMSLGCDCDIKTMHDAIINAVNSGVVVVAAAGNSYGGAVIYPAAYPEVIAVSATDQNNSIASFSSVGPEVDLSAPGVSIYSTYKGAGYTTLSGTSMASPHVAGAVALVMNTSVSGYDENNNGKWDPIEVKTRLQTYATDLGDTGFDNFFGWGLINAFAATQP